MTVIPDSIEDLAARLRHANATGAPVLDWNLDPLSQILEYRPEDMTATVMTGLKLSSLQAALSEHGQWLPIDPPSLEALSIADLLLQNPSGPRRHGYGTIRDYLIGIKVVLGDGQVIKAGGKVVKNVAGYDLCKLFIGSKGSLGIPVEATFKLRPLPEKELIFESFHPTLAELQSSVETIQNYKDNYFEPVIFDSDNLRGNYRLTIGFAGTIEGVDFQADLLRRSGFHEIKSLDEQENFSAQNILKTRSVLPSRIYDLLKQIGSSKFVARHGNGIVYSDIDLGENARTPADLMSRVKQAFDPNGILPVWKS